MTLPLFQDMTETPRVVLDLQPPTPNSESVLIAEVNWRLQLPEGIVSRATLLMVRSPETGDDLHYIPEVAAEDQSEASSILFPFLRDRPHDYRAYQNVLRSLEAEHFRATLSNPASEMYRITVTAGSQLIVPLRNDSPLRHHAEEVLLRLTETLHDQYDCNVYRKQVIPVVIETPLCLRPTGLG